VPVTGSRRWRPRWTLRLRLTALYGSLFLIAGAILLGITYGLVAHGIGGGAQQRQFVVSDVGRAGNVPIPALPSSASGPVAGGPGNRLGGATASRAPKGFGVQLRAYAGKVNATFSKASAKQVEQVASKAKAALNKQRSDELGSLLTESGIALGIMAIVSIGLGWLIAGRALRPVRTMGARARGISERNLHERLALRGPNDELKELGDTFDELLGRLETAFESQRRFVSNASHELRTPMTLERTLVEVALADPEASIESLQDTCRRVLAAGEQQERLIEALLTLARSQRGLDAREQIDLGELTADVIRGIDSGGVRLQATLGEAETSGDPRLLERLVANLVDNALKYNVEDGWVTVWTGVRDRRATVEVENAGPTIEPGRVSELLEPFRRLNGDRAAAPEPVGRRGLGLGLSIVDAIAEAHGARLTAAPRPEGGLKVEVRFPGFAVARESNGAIQRSETAAGSNL
jgi:signal transduction histidine kinase